MTTPAANKMSLCESAACCYLLLPTLVFFAFFIRPEIGLPACGLLIYCLGSILVRTDFQFDKTDRVRLLWFAFLAFVLAMLSGAGGLLYRNLDWEKHYALLNCLGSTPWPTRVVLEGQPPVVLRYSIGWYMLPALALKMTDLQVQDLLLSGWLAVGMTIFFWLISDLIPGKRGWLAGPALFMLFSGMDIIGIALGGYHSPTPYHLEWWPGWMQYSSTMTDLLWVPQHAIPAWLATAIILRQWQRPTCLDYLAALGCCVLLASPFAALGLIPFGLALCFRWGLRKTAFDWKVWAAVLLLGLPVAAYLTMGASTIVSTFIWKAPHVQSPQHPFSFPSYVLLMLLEVVPFAVILFFSAREYRGLWIAATALLLLAPFYRIGTYNDFAMRASIPALGLFAVLTAKTILTSPRRLALPALAIFLLGSVTAGGELARAFTVKDRYSQNASFLDRQFYESVLSQYFTSEDRNILRKP
jgi:hypothetical protein